MANELTGDFDVVVEMAVPRINRILAAQHQAGVFPHSFTLNLDTILPGIGTVTPVKNPAAVAVVTLSPRAVNLGAGQLFARAAASSSVPDDDVGSAVMLGHRINVSLRKPKSLIAEAGSLVDIPVLRGFAEIQASTPTITLPAPAGVPRVSILFDVRAYVTLDPKSVPLPQSIHGEIALTVDVAQVAAQKGSQFVVDLDFLSGNLDVRFTRASSTLITDSQVQVVEMATADLMSSDFVCANAVVDVPADVRDMQFKPLPGAQPAVALLLNLRDHSAAPSSPASVWNVFVQPTDDFAIAVGADYVVDTMRASIRKAAEDIIARFTNNTGTYTPDVPLQPFTYSIRVQDVLVVLEPGQVRVTLILYAHEDRGPWFTPDDYIFTLTQAFTLYLDNGIVKVAAAGDLDVNTSLPWPADGAVRDAIKGYVHPDDLVGPATSEVQSAIAKIDFGSILHDLQVPSAKATYTAVDVRPAGIILRGGLTLAAREKPVAMGTATTVTRSNQSYARLSAFASWIPGGRVDSYTWERGDQTIADRRHTFVEFVPLPADSGGPGDWCVLVKGVQTTDTGALVNVQRRYCPRILVVGGRLPDLDSIAQSRRAVVVVRPGPDPVPTAYVDPWSAGLASGGNASTLVHFVEDDPVAGLRAAREALDRSGHESPSLYMILVVPRGQLSRAAAAVAREESETRRGPRLVVDLSEDFEGGWQRSFAVHGLPATYLVGSIGQVLWKHVGRLEPEPLAEVLRKHLAAGGLPRYRPLVLGVEEGDRAPDFRFELVPGRDIPLRRLRHQPVVLAFWTTWAEPSLEELRRLQRRYPQGGRDRTLVLAINDGEHPAHARDVFCRHGLTLHLVTDPERTIARAYGVHCWPTVIELGGRGRVWSIQMGASHHEDDGEAAECGPAESAR